MGNWFMRALSEKGEVPFEEIEEMADNGKFHEWNFEAFDYQESGYEDVVDELKKFKAVDYLALDEKRKKAKESGNTVEAEGYRQQMEKMVEEVLKIYRSKNIFPIQYFSELGVMDEIEKCIAYKAKFDGNTVSCGAGIGTGLCRWLFPNLFDTPSAHDLTKKDAETQYKKFLNDEYLKRAIKFCYSYKDGCPTPTSVEGGLRLVGSAPSNFRPMNAKAVYERFCPKGGTIYDFCCLDSTTEFFNGREWKYIDDYKSGEKVLQYNEDGTATLVEPFEYINYESDDVFYEYEDGSISSCQTGNHDVVLLRDGKCVKVKQDTILESSTSGVPTVCLYDGDLSMSTNELLRELEDVENGYQLVFSDKLYRLSMKSKLEFMRLLLGRFTSKGLYGEYNYYGELENCRVVMHIARTSGYYCDFSHCDSLTIYTGEHKEAGYYEKDGKVFNIVNKKGKYCFVVPSHMLVLRRYGKVYITGNCGFGGRMLGALSSKNKYKYVGTDPCTETMYHLHQLGDYIEMVTGREDSYELHCLGSEDFRGPANSIDFAFSSPPYFNLEVYSDEPTQCYNKFPKLEDWLEGYVRETIKNIYHMLKPGHFYAVNIADFKVGGGGEVAYVDEWKRISAEEGMPLFDTVYLGVTARAGSAEQAAGELKKENIMVFKKPL